MAEPARELTPAGRAALQGGVVTRRQLEDALGSAALRRSLRSGDWQLVHRGTYAERALADAARDDLRLAHRLQCAARVLLSDRDLVVSGGSAAVLHGMRLLDPYGGPPQLTLVRRPGSPAAHERLPLAAGVPAEHREVVEGVPVTTRPRTVVDLARTLPRPAGVVMADAALRSGVSRAHVEQALRACRGWPGSARASRVLTLADPAAESALESLARVWFADAGLPPPVLQARLCTLAEGQFVARVDFFWQQHRTVCEVDGRLKYTGEGVLWQEKLREDALRDLGLEVVRGYWADRHDGGRTLVERVRRAFARAAARADAPAYGVLTSG